MEELQNNEPMQTGNIDNTDEKKGKRIWMEIFEWVQALVIAVVIAMLLRTFVFTFVNVRGTSMVPTLQNNDVLIVWRLAYNPQPGDIVVFRPERYPDTPYVKRVIATAGQTIDIDTVSGQIIVDGQTLEEDYIAEPNRVFGNIGFPLTVPEDSIFCMGDNRNNSKDSRYTDVGPIPIDDVLGGAAMRIWPLDGFGLLH